jgi:predicted ATPase
LNRGVNVLVGINGSGKSNFFKAFELIYHAVNRNLRRHILEIGGINEMLFKGERENDEIILEFEFDKPALLSNIDSFKYEGKVLFTLNLTPTQTGYFLSEKIDFNDKTYLRREGNSLTIEDNIPLLLLETFESSITLLKNNGSLSLYFLLEIIHNLNIYYYFDTRPESKIRKPNLSIPESRLSSDGSNLTQVLSTLKIDDKKSFNKIEDALRSVNPNFKGFDFRPFGTNFEMLLDEIGLNQSIHISKISDGTLRYICLMAILISPNKGFICIDEPETGLHPDMLYNIAHAVREASETSTVIVSTHSSQFLNYFNIDEVLVFEKDELNATQVYQYSENDFKDWYETFQVGNMWRQGDIGGNRYGS